MTNQDQKQNQVDGNNQQGGQPNNKPGQQSQTPNQDKPGQAGQQGGGAAPQNQK